MSNNLSRPLLQGNEILEPHKVRERFILYVLRRQGTACLANFGLISALYVGALLMKIFAVKLFVEFNS
jgi:hypothetical protein